MAHKLNKIYYIKMLHINEAVMAYNDALAKHSRAQVCDIKKENGLVYIHFLGEDKRFDKWISMNEVQKTGEDVTEKELNLGADTEVPPELREFEKVHKQFTKIRNIETVTIGDKTMRTWYFSPYPPPFYTMSHIFICDHCFQYFSCQEDLNQHLSETHELIPPGREIYREGNLSLFELKGWKQKICCQNLDLLAKFFLDHKTLYYDASSLIYYVLCECDENGAHIAAYFSKEIDSEEGNILACIVVLPPYQKNGYGRLLISIAYEMARRINKPGGPERPLSDLGNIAFHSYWRDTIVELLHDVRSDVETIDDIMDRTGISRNDITETLRNLSCLTFLPDNQPELLINYDSIDPVYEKLQSKPPKRKVNPKNLIWFKEDFEDYA